MTGAERQAPAGLGLERSLALQSAPLAVALVLIVTLSAPVAFYIVRVDELRAHARVVAAQVAAMMDHEVYRQPSLWKYNSTKLLRNLKLAREPGEIARVLVLDEEGTVVSEDVGAREELRGPLVWEVASLRSGERDAGTAWVAVSLRGPRALATFLVLPFLLVAVLLTSAVYLLPLRALRRAEAKIDELLGELRVSQQSLSLANQSLSDEVARRTEELRSANQALQQRDARLRALSIRAAGLQESERRAIARDLHDATGQALTAIRLNLQLLQAASGDPAAVAERTRSTVALVDTAIDEIRRAVNRLGPAIVQDVGLWTAVQAHCRDVGERSRLAIECSIECPSARPSPAVETSAYRIVQEALHNAVRHARPSHVSVRFAAQGDRLQLEVDNDGVAPCEDSTQSGFGLVAMRERAEVLGGSFAVERPSPDRCRVRVELPLLAASETDAGAREAWIRG